MIRYKTNINMSSNMKNNNGVYSTYSTTTDWIANWDLTTLLSKEQKEEILTGMLESEDEFMPILKKYLVGYLDKFLDNPEPLIKEVIKEKDERIQELENKINELEKEIQNLKAMVPLITNPTILDGDYWKTMPQTWYLGDVTASSGSTNATATKYYNNSSNAVANSNINSNICTV